MHHSALFVLASLAALLATPSCRCSPLEASEDEWKDWKQRHQKMYGDASEEGMRRAVWTNNYQKVSSHNEARLGFSLEMNEFADMVSVF